MHSTVPLSPLQQIKAIFAADVLRVRKGRSDPVYWYISNEPGPFYINSENFLGADNAECLLNTISSYLRKTPSTTAPFKSIYLAIMDLYFSTPAYRDVVASLLQVLLNSHVQVDLISGGERRDWLFSVPVAHELHVPHVWLTKSQDSYTMASDGRVIGGDRLRGSLVHVCDILNRGISFERYWLPALKKNGLYPSLALFVVDRSTMDKNFLNNEGILQNCLYKVDVAFFETAAAAKTITAFAFDEITLYLKSSDRWIEEVFIPEISDGIHFALYSEKDIYRARRFFRDRGMVWQTYW